MIIATAPNLVMMGAQVLEWAAESYGQKEGDKRDRENEKKSSLVEHVII